MKKKRRVYISIGIILSVMALIAVFAYKQEAQINPPEQDDPPTPIQLGVMNEKQRKNSRKFNAQGRTNLPDRAQNRSIRLTIGKPYRPIEPLAESLLPSQDAFLPTRVCNSQIVMSGRVVNKNSQLSELLNSVFTDYEFAVNEVFRNNSGLNILPPATITVSRPGGSILLNGKIIKVIDQSYQTLKVGKEYLLFLNYLRDSDTFVPGSSEGTFEIQGNKIFRLKEAPYRGGFEDSNIFIDLVKRTAQGCSN